MLNKNALKSHIKSDDMLATIATVVNLAMQDEGKLELRKDLLVDVIEELKYLQAFYILKKR